MFAIGVGLALIQVVAALPWLALMFRSSLGSAWQEGGLAGYLARWVATLAVLVVVVPLVLTNSDLSAAFGVSRDPGWLRTYGGFYAAVLQIQLIVDAFILFFALMLLTWPKGGAVALAAFRESWRQPMYWLLFILALAALFVFPFIPYFTFGEDFKMMRELGYDVMMLFPALFGVLAASMSISEEIEGRTAVTLMSKPVSRRQFLVGKFLGILLAAFMMTCMLSIAYDGLLLFKLYYDREPISVPFVAAADQNWLDTFTTNIEEQWGNVAAELLRGTAFWFAHVLALSTGVVLGFCQVMVLLAIAVALATRLPMIVNLVVCSIVFVIGNLTPVLQHSSQARLPLVQFMAQLFYYVFPGLELFNMGPAIAKDAPPPPIEFAQYVGSVSAYAFLYTCIALLFGLILFEDRDLG
ncbi:MAG: ABC transporter permease [Gemmataceae bacterium]